MIVTIFLIRTIASEPLNSTLYNIQYNLLISMPFPIPDSVIVPMAYVRESTGGKRSQRETDFLGGRLHWATHLIEGGGKGYLNLMGWVYSIGLDLICIRRNSRCCWTRPYKVKESLTSYVTSSGGARVGTESTWARTCRPRTGKGESYYTPLPHSWSRPAFHGILAPWALWKWLETL